MSLLKHQVLRESPIIGCVSYDIEKLSNGTKHGEDVDLFGSSKTRIALRIYKATLLNGVTCINDVLRANNYNLR